jgi:chromosome segregation ATPase
MEELRQSASHSIDEAANESVRAIKELATATSDGLRGETATLTQQVNSLSKAANKTVTALEKHAASLEVLSVQQLSATETLKEIERSVASATAVSEQMRSHVETAASSQGLIHSSASELSEAVSQLRDSVGGSASTLHALHSEFQERLEALERAPQSTLDAALKAIAAAAERLNTAIASVASKHEDAGRSIEALSSGLVQALQSHNSAIETELGRSRENAAKVHGALVDMASTLTDHIERRAQT